MQQFVKRVEKFLIRAIILALLIIVIAQGAMTDDSWRFYLSLGERMEGQRIEYPVHNLPSDERKDSADANPASLQSPSAEITLEAEKLTSLPHALVMVNGEEKANFADGLVVLELNAGDLLQIDGRYYDFPLSFMVKDCSLNLAYPEKGRKVKCNHNISTLGKIIVK